MLKRHVINKHAKKPQTRDEFFIFSWLNRRGWQHKKGILSYAFTRDISVAYYVKKSSWSRPCEKNKK
jgi:hypothetical protein